VEDPARPAVTRFALLGSAPNPFHNRTSIRYAMPEPGRVMLDVFDVQGRLVATRALGLVPAGSHSHLFDGRDLDSGLYLYRLRVLDPQAAVTKATLAGKLMLTR
jgi:hypothetical protein